jgi:hypothetical protein
MTTTASTIDNVNDNANDNDTNAVAWPYHVNPETGRANKCYKVDRCRFGIPADQHYATAAEALAHAPAKDAGTAKAPAKEKVTRKPRTPRATKAAKAVEPQGAEVASEPLAEVVSEAPAAPAKRRGRPRKNPLPAEKTSPVDELFGAAEQVAQAEVPTAEAQASEKVAGEPTVAKTADGILKGKDILDAQKHDTKVNKLYIQREEQQALLTGNLRTLAHRMGINLKKRIDPDKVIARAEASTDPDRIKKYLDWAKENLAAVEDAQQKIEKLDKNYTGWARYFIVPGGHIHTSTQCRTCNHSWEHPTQFEWLTTFSGEQLEDVVKQHGAVLCTVCFPEAPLDWTNYFDRLAEEKKKTQCSGSATWDYDLDTARLGQPSGNYGICEHCGEQISITSTGKLRAHRTPAVVDAAEAMTADAAKAKA